MLKKDKGAIPLDTTQQLQWRQYKTRKPQLDTSTEMKLLDLSDRVQFLETQKVVENVTGQVVVATIAMMPPVSSEKKTTPEVTNLAILIKV